MRFLVDEQLPPALAESLARKGHAAEHVHDVGLGGAADRDVWSYAVERRAALITKDEDFVELGRVAETGVAVIWIRLGNTTNKVLWSALEPLLPEIEQALSRGETLVEII